MYISINTSGRTMSTYLSLIYLIYSFSCRWTVVYFDLHFLRWRKKHAYQADLDKFYPCWPQLKINYPALSPSPTPSRTHSSRVRPQINTLYWFNWLPTSFKGYVSIETWIHSHWLTIAFLAVTLNSEQRVLLVQKLTCPFETLGNGTSARSFKTSGPPNEETRIALIVVIVFDFPDNNSCR